MEDLIKMLMERTGISQEQAGVVVEQTLDYVRDRLPESVADQLENVLEGKPFDYKVVMRQRLEEVKDDAGESMLNFSREMKVKLDEVSGVAEDKFQAAKKVTEDFLRRIF